ncbi:MAG: AAA family ATPase [Eubacteriales bacterium]|nr:AAA family ATPase [Eubacteriales bacterium]
MQKKKLPVGIENFEDIRKKGFYYIDKTGLIRDLLNNWSMVNLFTRPRRFGKTLNMSMLKYFFGIGTDKTLFDGLAISQETALCEEYMGKYPVIFISLKGVDGLTYELAIERLKTIIQEETMRLHSMLKDELLSPFDSKKLSQMENRELPEKEIPDSLKFLSRVLYTCFGQKVILLIDEYDVPLDKAFQHGYYEEMVSLIRGMFGQALKTNDFLEFAVLTGCLRVSKESIFTGLNNFDVNSIVDVEHDEQFGFTDSEVRELLEDYGLKEKTDVVKEWYNGYRFGNANIYCPWDVIKYTKKLLADPHAEPEAFWINTSGNELVKRFIDKADKTTQNEIERLVAGEAIEKALRLDLTYNELDASIANLWSVLFTTGYLTQAGKAVNGIYKLVIPNREVREVFVLQIQEWFKECVADDEKPMRAFCRAFLEGKAEDIQKQLNVILNRMISVLDAKAPDDKKENFYHGLLLGLLRSEARWLILSNAESGDGFSDILVEPDDPDAGIVIEVKYASSIAGLDKACEEALMQIKEKRYDERLRNDGMTEVLAYGIAFCKKRCKVVCGK